MYETVPMTSPGSVMVTACVESGCADVASCLARPKSRIFTRPLSCHHDVVRFQIAVGNASIMGGGHSVGNLHSQIEQFADIRRGTDRLTIEELHYQIVRPDIV